MVVALVFVGIGLLVGLYGLWRCLDYLTDRWVQELQGYTYLRNNSMVALVGFGAALVAGSVAWQGCRRR